MKKVVDSKNPPSLKDYPTGYVVCEGGYWTYSSHAVRFGFSGWMFHKNAKTEK